MTAEPLPSILKPQMCDVAKLKAHPRNYREHPPDQIAHLAASIRQHGFYRNVVVAREGTVLAGHGVVLAARQLGMEQVPVVVLPVSPDDPRALKVMASDNTLPHLALDDDRKLTELLKDIAAVDDLLGTGYDEQMLAALAMVTRPAEEIRTIDEAAEWANAGMPGFESKDPGPKLILQFENEEARATFMAELGIVMAAKVGKVCSAHWPPRPKDDCSAVRFEG